MPINFIIDGKPAADYSDDELIAINQRQGQKQDEIRLGRIMINRELAERRALAALEAARAATRHAELVVVDAAAPGAVLDAIAARP